MKLYHVVRPIVQTAFKIYFRKIYHFGGENIPKNKPVILSVNHPTAFFEPTLLATTFTDFDFYFITRGDIFQKPVYRKILESLLMIPIYRQRDGFDNLRKNTDSMESITNLLGENATIQIFSEGTTITVKRLRPIQKGMSRMAFDAYQKFGDRDLQIVPICITYSAPHVPRGEVMIKVGKAIPLSNYYDLFAENTAKAVNKLTKDVETAMRPLLVHVEKDEDLELADRLFALYRHSFPVSTFPIAEKSERRLLAQQEMADNLNTMDTEKRAELGQKVDRYFGILAKYGLKDIAVAQPYHASFTNLLMLIIGFLPFCIGWFGHYLPNAYGRKIRDTRVKYLEFKGPVGAGVSMAGTIIQYLVLLLAAIIINHWAFWCFLFVLPFLGYYSLIYNELWKKYGACQRLKRLDTEGGLLALRQDREAILKMVRRH